MVNRLIWLVRLYEMGVMMLYSSHVDPMNRQLLTQINKIMADIESKIEGNLLENTSKKV